MDANGDKKTLEEGWKDKDEDMFRCFVSQMTKYRTN